MKFIVYLMMTITLLSCTNAKKVVDSETKSNDATPPSTLINDIWVVESILGKEFVPNEGKIPQIEFQISENRVAGNDGCNSFSGSTKQLDDKNLVFGMLAATKMACEDMSIQKSFHQAIQATTSYSIEKLRLTFYNEKKEAVMVLKKVD